MEINFLVLFATALIPMFVGFVYYNEKVFGKIWAREAGVTDEQIKSGNMALIFGLSFLFAVLLAFAMTQWSIHQFSAQGLFATQPGFADGTGEFHAYFTQFMNKYGTLHRSFGHGAVHGAFASIAIVLPLIGTNALFERRSWKYILIHWGYWAITLILMCGVLCQFF